MRPNKELRIAYNTDYLDKSSFASRARLLQSIWRVEKGFDCGKYGNFLEEEFAKSSGENYLTTEIFKIVKEEVKNKHIEGKVISEPRIWNNLLSSQPLAFNLFGELKLNLSLASTVFSKIYPEREIQEITDIKFEYSPGRKSLKYTGDSSAFDVFIEYQSISSKNCFLGIEVKYAEDLNDKPATHKTIYETISQKANIFDLSMLEKLKEKPIQQIWRDHLLALSLFITNEDYHKGDFIYLYPTDNTNCIEGIEQYQSTFTKEESYFKPLTIEELVKAIKEKCSEKWILDFEDRYLNFEKIKRQ